jgi:hypothetical protein
MSMTNRPILTDEGLTTLLEMASESLSRRGSRDVVLLVARLLPLNKIKPNEHGWALLGRIYAPQRRYWWIMLWHFEEGRGRLLGRHWETDYHRDEFERLMEGD